MDVKRNPKTGLEKTSINIPKTNLAKLLAVCGDCLWGAAQLSAN